jgi:3',5'-cyclic-AMP phosphodiesterase
MKNKIALISFISIILIPDRFLLAQQAPPEDFNFIFMTDIHLEPGRKAPEGFKMAIDTANKLDADFVLTGGDLIADALGASFNRSDSLYALYSKAINDFNKPVYNTVGNHELFGLYKSSGVDSTHNDYDDGMFKRYFGEPYYSFNHKGWHFIILKSIADAGNKYKGFIDDKQIAWLKNDLAHIDHTTPIILSTHIPLITTYFQFNKRLVGSNAEELMVTNSLEILNILADYNLKLVLQGHLHMIEDIYIQNKIHFLTGGAISARWWGGPLGGMEEGFMIIRLRGGKVEWNYVDYGWEVAVE